MDSIIITIWRQTTKRPLAEVDRSFLEAARSSHPCIYKARNLITFYYSFIQICYHICWNYPAFFQFMIIIIPLHSRNSSAYLFVFHLFSVQYVCTHGVLSGGLQHSLPRYSNAGTRQWGFSLHWSASGEAPLQSHIYIKKMAKPLGLLFNLCFSYQQDRLAKTLFQRSS